MADSPVLTPDQVKILMDCLLLRVLATQGGQMTMSWEECLAITKEYDGWSIRLRTNERVVQVTMESPAQREEGR